MKRSLLFHFPIFGIGPPRIKNKVFGLLLLMLPIGLCAQSNESNRFQKLELKLDSLSKTIPGLNEQSDLALANVPLHDFIRALGKVHRINVYIDDTEKQIVTNHFMGEPVKSIFLFTCKKFNLDIEATGTILNFIPYVRPKQQPPPPPPPAELKVYWEKDQVSFDLKNDSLSAVLRKLSRISGRTLITGQNVKGTVSGYIPPSDFETGLEGLLFMNNMVLSQHRNGFYVVDAVPPTTVPNTQKPKGRKQTSNTVFQPQRANLMNYQLEIATDTLGTPLIFLKADQVATEDILKDLFLSLELEYFLFEQIEGATTLNVQGKTLEEVLKNLFQGTGYTWKNDNGVFLIGNREMEGLRKETIISLNYRPTEQVIELIPTTMREGVELKEYVELNKIIVSGPSERLEEIKQFILEIDRPVPMVKIEMVVVEVNFSRLLKTSVRAGLLSAGDTIGAVKTVAPGLDYTLNGSEINRLFAASGIPFLSGIGALSSNFYLSLQAQESRGNIRIVTQPVISTLNGNEASITVGSTEYYQLETFVGSNSAVNSYNQVAQRFERFDINTVIKVKPFISQDGMVTLDVSPHFTTPGTRVSNKLPPAMETRSFESIIRVKDGDTVILGGLSRESTSNSNSGLPLLSRIPGLKWLFGSVSRDKSKSSLMIFITPTIYYN